MSESAKHYLNLGANYPWEASDAWWDGADKAVRPPATDWAHAAARGVMENLLDRGKIKHGFNDIDESIRVDIVRDLATIIRLAHHHHESPT